VLEVVVSAMRTVFARQRQFVAASSLAALAILPLTFPFPCILGVNGISNGCQHVIMARTLSSLGHLGRVVLGQTRTGSEQAEQ
jgi:hypothetical protein